MGSLTNHENDSQLKIITAKIFKKMQTQQKTNYTDFNKTNKATYDTTTAKIL